MAKKKDQDHEQERVLSLEEKFMELEKIVKGLENGNLPITEGLKLFETGVHLFKQCKKELGDVENKVKILTDKLKEEDFDYDKN